MKQRQRFEPWRQFLFSALLLLAMGMAVTACSSEEDRGDSENNTRKELSLHIWKLSMYVNKETGIVENAPQPDGSFRLSLKLKENNTFIAYCAKDWFRGEYSISGSNISFKTNEILPIDKIGSPLYEGFHPDYEKESLEYFERINSCSAFKVADNQLWLYLNNRKEYLLFNATFE